MADDRHRIERIIQADPVIKKGLQRGIINSRALVRFMQRVDGMDSTPESILGIIRRYPLEPDNHSPPHHVFRGCELSIGNKVADLAIENGPDVMQRIAEFARTIKTTKGENLRVVVGLTSIRLIADQRTLDRFRKTLREQEIIRYATNLVEISLLFPPEAEETQGIYAKIVTELALNDVNLIGITCCSPESILLVAENDAPRAFDALQRLVVDEGKVPTLPPPVSSAKSVRPTAA